ADKAAFPRNGHYREFLRQAFVARGIVPNKAALNIDTNFELALERPVDLNDLVESDWVAYQFANQYRDVLHIPASVQNFHVHRRLKTQKRFNEGGAVVNDIVFKVSWDHIEANAVGRGLPGRRRITAGTTLVINADRSRDAGVEGGGGFVEVAQAPAMKMDTAQTQISGQQVRRLREVSGGKGTLLIRARLTSDLGERQRQARDAMLEHLMQEGLIELDAHATGPDGKLRTSIIHGLTRHNVLKLSGTGRMLHITTR
ncbi:MAG: hypothetical protein P1S60_19735, partial [Anaerolineae bacterium]|nr:hypothetical protein [Anaerolineae bacterium]